MHPQCIGLPAVSAAAVSAAISAAVFSAGTRFVDRKCTAVDFAAVEPLNRVDSVALGRHFNEAETAMLAAETIGHDACRRYFAELAEDRAELLVLDIVRKVSYVNIHAVLLCSIPEHKNFILYGWSDLKHRGITLP